MTFTCPTSTGTLCGLDHCYRQIPLSGGHYMDPTSKLLVKKPKTIACSQHFPVVVRTEEGWVELPVLKAIPAPAPGHHGLEPNDDFTDFSVTNIYTQTELEDFHQLLSFPEYRESKLSEILFGDCMRTGTCTAGQMTGGGGPKMYDLSTLEKGPLAMITNPLSAIWKTLVNKATNIGAYMGLILGIGHLLFLAIYIYKKGLKTMCSPFNTAWKKITNKEPTPSGQGPTEPPTKDEHLTGPGVLGKGRADCLIWAGRDLLQDAKVVYQLTRPTEPPPSAPSSSRALELLRPVESTPSPPAYSSATRGTPNKRDTLHYSQARYGLLDSLQ